jgi:hypothetical protein
MAFVLTTDPAEFSDQTAPFLEANVECNVLATVLMSVRSGRYRDVQPVFGYEVDALGTVTAAVLRTPPSPMLTSRLAPETVDAVLAAWLRLDPALPVSTDRPRPPAMLLAPGLAGRAAKCRWPGRWPCTRCPAAEPDHLHLG